MNKSLFAICLAAPLMSSVQSFSESKHREHGHHMHGKELHLRSGPNAPSVSATIKVDPVGGYNLHVMVKNFRFAPENASGEHVAGEGHGHIFVNGKNTTETGSGRDIKITNIVTTCTPPVSPT